MQELNRLTSISSASPRGELTTANGYALDKAILS